MKPKARREPAASPEQLAEMDALAKCVGPLEPKQIALFTRLFPLLLARHGGVLKALLGRWRLARDQEDDVTQLVLLDVFTVVRDEGFARGDFDAVLRDCFRNRVSNYLRRRLTRRETALPTSSVERPRSLGSEERHAIALAALTRLCEKLSDLELAIFDLVIIRRVPHTEAAELLDITPGTLKACVGRLRELLAKVVGEVEGAS